MVVGVALAWLLLFEPIGGDPRHPPTHKRLKHASQYFDASETSAAVEAVSHLLKVVISRSRTAAV